MVGVPWYHILILASRNSSIPLQSNLKIVDMYYILQEGVQQLVLGLYIIRGDNMSVIL